MVEITDLVTLSDDNEYVVVSKTFHEGKIYYFLVDVNDSKNIKFLYEDGEELVEFDDNELLKTLMPKFLESVKASVPADLYNEAANLLTPEKLNQIAETLDQQQ